MALTHFSHGTLQLYYVKIFTMKFPMTFNVGVVVYPPYVNYCWRTCQRAGLLLEIVQLLCSTYKLQCTYEEFQLDDTENRTMDAFVAKVQDGTLNTTVPVISATPERIVMVEFSPTIFFVPQVFIFRTPAPTKLSMSKIMAMDWKVWICLLACMVIVALILTMTEFKSFKATTFLHFSKNCFDAYAIFTNQTQDQKLIYSGTRILVVFWAVAAVIVTGIYSGNLLASLLKSSVSYPFHDYETFVGCLEMKNCQLVTISMSTSLMTMLTKGSEIKYFERISNALQASPPTIIPNFFELAETILNTTDKYLVWIATEPTLSIVTKNHNADCLFTSIQSGLLDRFHFPIAKNSTFYERLTSFSNRIQKSGIHMSIYHKYYMENNLCQINKQVDETKPMPIASMFSLLFTMFTGCALSFVAFWFEKLSAAALKIKNY